jgi:recombination protein RecR
MDAPGDSSEGGELQRLIDLLAKLPGLGPRSARRAVFALVKRRDALLRPLAAAMTAVAEKAQLCRDCGNLDTAPVCAVCRDPEREDGVICVVEEVGDLWAMERAGAFRGRYHVLGGTLSALDDMGPEALRIPRLLERAASAREVILALNATVEGMTTAHYIADSLKPLGVSVTSLAQGVPIGGELDYLDDGTIGAALKARRAL